MKKFSIICILIAFLSNLLACSKTPNTFSSQNEISSQSDIQVTTITSALTETPNYSSETTTIKPETEISDTTQLQTTEQTSETIHIWVPFPGPILIDNLNDTIKFINDEDYYAEILYDHYGFDLEELYKKYGDEMLAYENIVNVVKEAGFIPVAKNNYEGYITIYPENYDDDVGITSDFEYNGKQYLCYIYYPKLEYSDSETIQEYHIRKYGTTLSNLVEIKFKSQTIIAQKINYAGNSFLLRFIYDNLIIQIECNNENATDLLNNLDIVKVPLE